MDDSELRRGRAVRIVLAGAVLVLNRAGERSGQLLARAREEPIVGPASVSAPMPLVRTGRGVDDDDAMVDVAVGNVQFVGRGVEHHAGWGAEVLGVVAPAALTLVPDLHQERSLARELQDVRVFVAARAEPHVILVVHVDAMFELWP